MMFLTLKIEHVKLFLCSYIVAGIDYTSCYKKSKSHLDGDALWLGSVGEILSGCYRENT